MKTTLCIITLFIALSSSGCALFTPMTPAQTTERQALIASSNASKTQTRKTRRTGNAAKKKLRSYWDYSKGKRANSGSFGLGGCHLKVCQTK